jgi:hypothetical protein
MESVELFLYYSLTFKGLPCCMGNGVHARVGWLSGNKREGYEFNQKCVNEGYATPAAPMA